jgi:hypothetical protein
MKEHIVVAKNTGGRYVVPLAPEVRGKLRVSINSPVVEQQLKAALYNKLMESILLM